MSEVIITVRGHHETRIAPERAVAQIVAAVDGPERGPVIDRLAAVAEPVRAELADRAAAGTVAEWSSQRVSVWAERPWNQDGRQLDPVHHASVQLTATFTDPSALGDWLNSIVDNDGLQVGAISWELSPETRARVERETATVAVAVAVERATAYAHAISCPTLTPLEIADLGLLNGGDAPAAPEMMRMARASVMSDAGSAPAVELQPDDIVVSAAVEARFRAS